MTTETTTQKLVLRLGIELFSLAISLSVALKKLGAFRRVLLDARMDDLCATHEALCHACDLVPMWQVRTAAHLVHNDVTQHRSRRAIIRAARQWIAKRRLA